jgi:UDP-N-acetylmuramyl pentapeptide phosphotransferase/UDP-N-acetylglucosamine-1-phosphate transferase
MSAVDVARFVAVALGSSAATLLLARLAERHGFTDAPGPAAGADAARKLQGRGVPAVGGAALLLGLAWAPRGGLARGADLLWGRFLPDVGWLALSLALVFAAGAIDDRVRLSPGAKALAQLAALVPMASRCAFSHIYLPVAARGRDYRR